VTMASGECLSNATWAQSIQISTSLSFSRRFGNTFYSRLDGKLLNVEELSKPSTEPISPTDLMYVFNRFFSDPPLAVNETTTTTASILWLSSYINVNSVSLAGSQAVQTFLCELITLPLLLFQSNYVSGANEQVDLTPTQPKSGLPSESYVTVSLAETGNRIIVARWTVIVFASLALALYALCMGLYLAMRSCVDISYFPLVDFASRVVAGGTGERSASQVLMGVTPSHIRQSLQGKRLSLTQVDTPTPSMVSASEDKDVMVGFHEVITLGR